MCILSLKGCYTTATASVVDNTIEQLDLKNMGIAVEILFLAVLCDERVLLLVLDSRHIYFRYNATSGDIVENTTEQLDLENTGWNFVTICAL